jgi:predicted transposase YbfD/YdcC
MAGAVVTFDALHANADTFSRVVEDLDADFLVCVKDNASGLRRTIEDELKGRRREAAAAETLDHGHGRVESRKIEVLPIDPGLTGWPHTHCACRVTRDTKLVRGGMVVGERGETVHYVGSMNPSTRGPEGLLALTRGHWGVENSIHHRKDRSMDEDRNRAGLGKGKSGECLALLRTLVASVFRKCGETMRVAQRRLSSSARLKLSMLFSSSCDEWLAAYAPFKLKRA